MNHFYVPLSDHRICLVPITKEHIREMRKLSADSDIWRWYTEDLTNPKDLENWMTKRLEASEKGSQRTDTVK